MNTVESQPDPMFRPSNPLENSAVFLEKFVNFFANIFCWAYAFLIAVIILNVVMRYGFKNGLIIFEEIQWHLYAIGMMFGLSYAESTNSQVRVDIVASRLKPTTICRWEIFGILIFVYPFIFVVVYNAWDYVAYSYSINETSDSPLGLPYRWAIKAVIPLSFLLLCIAVTARLLKNTAILIYGVPADKEASVSKQSDEEGA